ncbi:MAG: two-component regulator propeller domain-containing protein [Cytophagales bacterium]
MRSYKILIFLLFFSFFSKAQHFLHREYGVSEGLDNPYVYSLAQDSSRLIWIGTAEGLYQFNGKKFTPYFTKDGIASDFIYSICVDNNNNKWFGHDDGSITFFNDKYFKKRLADTIINSRINKIVLTKSKKVLVCTQSNGLFSIDKKLKPSLIPFFSGNEIIWDVAEISSGNLIVCTDQGAYILVLENGVYAERIALSELLDLSVISVSKSKTSNTDYIIATEYDGIFTLQIVDKNAYLVRKLIEKDVTMGDQLYFANFDDKNGLWVSRNKNGITKSGVENQKINTQKSYWQESFNNYYIKSFLLDHEGNYWLGTYGNGIIQLTNNIFLLNKPKKSENIPFTVKSVATKNDSVLLTTGSDLYVFAKDSFSLLKIKNLPKNRKEPLTISCLFYNKVTGKILIGTTNFGILEYDEVTERTKHWYYNEHSNNINNIVYDNKMNIWIATENGAFRYNSAENAFDSFTMQDGLAHNNIHTIFADKSDRIWFATHSSGLSYFKDDKISFITTPFKSKPIDINCFAEGKDSTLWIGTDGDGVVCMKDTTVTNYITKQNGLLSNFCYTISLNERGNVWVGHKNGLSEITPKTQKIYNTSNSDLLQEVEMYLNAIAVNKQIIWYGTNKGLLKYNPTDADESGKENSNLITSFKIFFNHPDSVKYNYYRSFLFPPDNLQLSYKENHVTIEFVGICLSDPNKVLYKYYLEGYDEGWSPETDLTQITYSNLPAGKYIFHLISMNQNGLWTSKPTIYKFEVIPPYYQTWWFYTLVISLTVLVVIGAFTYRTQQLHKKNDFLVGEKLKLESEILQRKMTEEKLKRSEIQLQRANEELNTFIWRSYHDLRGPLKTIQGLVYVALSETEKKAIVSYLELINSTTTKLDALLQQFSKVTEVRKSKISITKINIEEIVEASLVSALKSHNCIDYEISKDVSVNGDLYFDKNFLFTLIHHVFDNAVIFSQNGIPVINIKIKQYGSQLKIVISDKGNGIQPEALPKVFDMFYRGTSSSIGYGLGLYIVNKIANIFDGSVNIFSALNEGTTVVIRLKNQLGKM